MRCCTLIVLVLATLVPVSLHAAEISVKVDAALRNPWPAELEKEFQERMMAVLKAQTAQEEARRLGGRTYFENEKRAYGVLMAHAVAGQKDEAIKQLQSEDAQAKDWHSHTQGIDYYACFTLKHQMRKYFLFGDQFEPAYRKRMFEGARSWTEKDPLRRPHHAFKKAGEGWGPDVRNSWVDIRGTENLFLMRITSVYLMAEETGNEETRQLYKSIVLNYARSLYRVGMGEWDSENYHGHSIAPLLNLHDFSKDPQVKAAAKACLDYICAIGAVKYYRGAFNGPSNRDYNHPQPFGGSAANILWLYFGDSPRSNERFESDEVHVATSGYRPPMAVVHLARKNFDRPREIFSAKPHYSAATTTDLTSGPESYETQYFGATFQMGSLVNGTSPGVSAINGFKITMHDDAAGAIAIQGVPGPDPAFVGSALYQRGKVPHANRVAQYRQAAIWLVAAGDSPWVWTFPKDVAIEHEQGVTFLKSRQTWIAMTPLHASAIRLDEVLTARLIAPDDKGRPTKWAGHQVVASTGKGGSYCGVAIEVGEAAMHKDFATFKAAILNKARVDVFAIEQGHASYTSSLGQSVAIQFGATPTQTKVTRDGVAVDWAQRGKHAFHDAGGGQPLIHQDWLGGKLTIHAGGAMFTSEVDDQGQATFRHE